MVLKGLKKDLIKERAATGDQATRTRYQNSYGKGKPQPLDGDCLLPAGHHAEVAVQIRDPSSGRPQLRALWEGKRKELKGSLERRKREKSAKEWERRFLKQWGKRNRVPLNTVRRRDDVQSCPPQGM